jgi:hypothetical protein
LRQISDKIGLTVEPMYVEPLFSPSERFVACAPGEAYFWRPPYDEWPEDCWLS